VPPADRLRPFDVTDYVHALGLSQPHGEPGYTTLERLWERPTLEINGIAGGGKDTVIPHQATAHVSYRLATITPSSKVRRSG